MYKLLILFIILLPAFSLAQEQGHCTYRFADVGQEPSGLYQGQCQDDKAHGQGRIDYDDGDIYEGSFKNGVKHGQGTYTWISGSHYQGEWRDDERNGQGSMTWVKGHRKIGHYQGEWRDNKRNGQGKYSHKSGMRLRGEWRDDKLWKGTKIFAYGSLCRIVPNINTGPGCKKDPGERGFHWK